MTVVLYKNIYNRRINKNNLWSLFFPQRIYARESSNRPPLMHGKLGLWPNNKSVDETKMSWARTTKFCGCGAFFIVWFWTVCDSESEGEERSGEDGIVVGVVEFSKEESEIPSRGGWGRGRERLLRDLLRGARGFHRRGNRLLQPLLLLCLHHGMVQTRVSMPNLSPEIFQRSQALYARRLFFL